MSLDTNKDQKKSSRSSGYPVFSLEDCVDAVKQVKQGLGMGFSSRDLIAKAMGYSGVTGASGTKISACVHFGLLSRSGNTYAVSELSNKILTPVSEDEKRGALVEAANSPSLYDKLITAYDGKALPNMLENILSREYGIIDNSAKRAAEIFKKSLEYAGLLRNGVVQGSTAVANKDLCADSVDKDDSNDTQVSTPLSGSSKKDNVFEIDLLDTGAKLLVPKAFSYEIGTGELADEILKIGEKLKAIKLKYDEAVNER